MNKLPRLCADCVEDSEEEVRPGEGDTPDQTGTQQQQQQRAGSLKRSKRFVRKPSVQTETKYIELMVVNDNDMVSLRSDVPQGGGSTGGRSRLWMCPGLCSLMIYFILYIMKEASDYFHPLPESFHLDYCELHFLN